MPTQVGNRGFRMLYRWQILLEDIRFRRTVSIASPLLLSGVVLWIGLPMFFHPGPLLQTDQPVWTAVAHQLKTEVIPDQKWFWGIVFDQENAGQVLGTSYSLNLILLWGLANLFGAVAAVKAATLLSALVLSLGAYSAARELLPPVLAAVAAFFIFAGASEHLLEGTWYNHLAIGLALGCWALLSRYLAEPSAGKWAGAVLTFTLAAYAHPIGAIGAGLAWLGQLPASGRRLQHWRRNVAIRYYLMIPFLALLLTSPQALAVLAGNGGTPYTFETTAYPKWRQFELLLNHNLLPREMQRSILFLAVPGLLLLLRFHRRQRRTLLLLLVVSAFLVSRGLARIPLDLSVAGALTNFADRFRFWLQIVYVLLAGLTLNALWDWLYYGRLPRLLTVILSAALLLLTWKAGKFTRHELALLRNAEGWTTLSEVRKSHELQTLWNWLDTRLDPNRGRVHFEDTYLDYDWQGEDAPFPNWRRRSHLHALAGLFTEIKQIGGWCHFTTGFAQHYNRGVSGLLAGKYFAPDSVSRKKIEILLRYGALNRRHTLQPATDSLLAADLQRLNIALVVVHSRGWKAYLEKSSAFVKQAEIGEFAVFSLKHRPPGWAVRLSDGKRQKLIRQASHRFVLEADGRRGEPVLVSLAYNRRWRARWQGQKVPLHASHELLLLYLPQDGRQIIELEFGIRRNGALVGLAVGLSLFAVLLFLQRRNERA